MRNKVVSLLLISIYFFNNSCLFADVNASTKELMKQARKYMYRQPLKAINYASSAKEKAVLLNDSSLLFDTNVLLGSVFSMNGNYDLALEAYLDAENYLDYYDLGQLADFNLHMASMYFNLENAYKSHVFNDLAYNLYEDIQDSTGMAWCLNLRGLVYAHEQDYHKAQMVMDSSLHIHKSMNNEDGVFIVVNNLSAIPGDELQKISKLKEVIAYNEKHKNKWTLAENFNNMGLLYIHTGDLETAKLYLKKARWLADSLHANVIKRDNLLYASQIAVQENKYKEAYQNHLEIMKINKLINSVDRVRQIEDDAYNRKQWVHLQNLEKKDYALKVAQREKLNLFVSAVLLLVVVILAIRMYHMRKINRLISHAENESQKKLQLRKELEQKEDVIHNQNEILNLSKKEMTDLVYFIKSKDKLLDNVIQMLQEAQKKSVEDPKMKIKSTIALIKNFREKEMKTDLFINEINKNEQAFLERLMLAHEDLSKNEVVLATLLRIGLSSKEIALLIDSNPKTVNMARYRLRKKLNLETDDNLVSYFESL
ncbi:MAG: helix-turn-helix transcriptional regulator [Bacteroidales bacterium]